MTGSRDLNFLSRVPPPTAAAARVDQLFSLAGSYSLLFSRSPHKRAFAGLFSHISPVKCPNPRSLFVDIHPAPHTGYLKLSTTTTLAPTVSSCSPFHLSSFSPRSNFLSSPFFLLLLIGDLKEPSAPPPSPVQRTCAKTEAY